MKSPKALFWSLLLLTLSFTACDEDDSGNVNNDPVLSDEEALAVLEVALDNTSGGIAADATEAALLAKAYSTETVTEVCGSRFDTTLSYSYDQPRLSASYLTSLSWVVNCNEFRTPLNIEFDRVATGSLETNRLLSLDEMSNEWLIEGLIAGDAYLLSGTYLRNGEHDSKVRDENQFDSRLEINTSMLTIDKLTLEITGGRADYTLRGEGTEGRSYSFTGSIEFLGNQAAQVTINEETYDISW